MIVYALHLSGLLHPDPVLERIMLDVRNRSFLLSNDELSAVLQQ